MKIFTRKGLTNDIRDGVITLSIPDATKESSGLHTILVELNHQFGHHYDNISNDFMICPPPGYFRTICEINNPMTDGSGNDYIATRIQVHKLGHTFGL